MNHILINLLLSLSGGVATYLTLRHAYGGQVRKAAPKAAK